MDTKKKIRQKIVQKRKSMSCEEWKRKSDIICNKIMENYKYKESRSVFCYASVGHEVCLTKLIQDALQSGKQVAMPKVEGENIRFYLIDSMDEMLPGAFGILEPDTARLAKQGELVIVPGVAFSITGERLGYGGGFYDRFLSENDIYSIGAAYDFQMVDTLPTEPHDKKINLIITD